MYSVVLMMALSGGGDSIDHRCHGCASSHGCHATRAHSSCHGCQGGLFSRLRCHGCSSACHSRCHTVAVSHGCHSAGHGCHSRGHGCHSSCHGGLFSRLRCHGGNACHGACSSSAPAEKVKAMPKEEKKKKTEEVSDNSTATIVVSLPADARLTVDGNVTRSTSERRSFVTPALDDGVTYVYTLRAEIIREGQTAVQTQDVTVRGGETTDVSFNFASQGVASR